jgi:hypothetical protein
MQGRTRARAACILGGAMCCTAGPHLLLSTHGYCRPLQEMHGGQHITTL